MHFRSIAYTVPVLLLGALGMASAQDHSAAHETMQHGQAEPSQAAETPSTTAYKAANMAMHEAMDIEFTGDADIDFARGMIGHHKGAIDMAKIMLEHGEDPELRDLAQQIIDAQEEEIAFLEAWLAENAEGR